MSILNGGPAEDQAMHRIFPVTAKLTKQERKAVTEFARSQGLARGQWIREVILRAMHSAASPDPLLAETVGIRLLLVNVLRPLAAGQQLPHETFDKLLDEIGSAKHDLASKIAFSEKERIHG
jgi:hypothetical protein